MGKEGEEADDQRAIYSTRCLKYSMPKQRRRSNESLICFLSYSYSIWVNPTRSLPFRSSWSMAQWRYKHIENINNSQMFQLWQMQSVEVTDGEYYKVYFQVGCLKMSLSPRESGPLEWQHGSSRWALGDSRHRMKLERGLRAWTRKLQVDLWNSQEISHKLLRHCLKLIQ